MQKRLENKALLILVLQGFAMIGVTTFPYFEHGWYDFNLLPLAWHKSLGFVLCFSGLVLLILSLKAMKSNFEIQAKPKLSGKLVRDWPFSMVRNPIYLAGVILALGWAISFKSSGSLLMTLVLYFILLAKIKYEEIFLLEKFGEDYIKYKNEVPKIFPFK